MSLTSMLGVVATVSLPVKHWQEYLRYACPTVQEVDVMGNRK